MVLRYWKYLLPLFKGAGRKIYSLEALYFLYHYNFELLPQQAERLLWSRIISKHGVVGQNMCIFRRLSIVN